MAKAGLVVGVEGDVTGLRKLSRDVTAELEKVRGQVNNVGSMMTAAMAMPIVGMVRGLLDARQQARELGVELATPFSGEMIQAQIDAQMRQMEFAKNLGKQYGGQMSEMIARKQDIEIAQVSQAMAPSDFEKGITSFFSNLTQPLVYVGQELKRIGMVAAGEDVKGYEMQRVNLEQERALAIMTGQGNVGQLNAMIQRLDTLISNTKGTR